jgi:phosphohistidine phosphatase
MRRLLLLRHAKSDWSVGGQRDIDRALAERGRKVAPLMGDYLARHRLRPDRIVVSSARRTRETCDLILPAFKDVPPVAFEPRIYEAPPKALLEVVRASAVDAHSLMVIGHNPGIQELASLLMAQGDIRARQSLLEKFPTAALAVIDFPIDRWSDIAPHTGRLDRFITPKMLDGGEDD